MDRLRLRVSIRSPYRSKGRYGEEGKWIAFDYEFQSAPLTEARGDWYQDTA